MDVSSFHVDTLHQWGNLQIMAEDGSKDQTMVNFANWWARNGRELERIRSESQLLIVFRILS